jgi:DNA-binding transcriptional ArsR family regulator
MAWVLNNSPASGTGKLILLGIANHADENGENAWPSVRTLARYASVSERSAQYALRKLEDAGMIVVHRQAGGTQHTPSDRRPNLYSVVMAGVQHASPRPPSGVQPASPRGATSFVHGVQPTAPEPSLNRPEPPAGSLKKIDKALSLAATKTPHKITVLRERHTETLQRYCTQWPDIASEQLAEYVITGSLPQTVSSLRRAS